MGQLQGPGERIREGLALHGRSRWVMAVLQHPPVAPVLVEKVAKSDFSQGFQSNGNFTPVRELTYLAETAGRITKLSSYFFAAIGSEVARGNC